MTHLHFWLAPLFVFFTATPGTSMSFHTSSIVGVAVQIKNYSVTPNQGRAGQDYDLLIISSADDCQTTSELGNAKLITPQGTPITVIDNSSHLPCSLTARIRIPADAPVGKFTLWVGEEKKAPIGFVEFSIVDFPQPGQIPPGVFPPAVDVMWSVMPKKIVGDNFGNAIARRYYAIEIIIGNNSAYTLQLVSVGFELPSDQELEGLVARNAYNEELKKNDSKANIDALRKRLLPPRTDAVRALLSNPALTPQKKTLLPTSSYKITRGSLEAKQLLHLRTLVLSSITALGPIFTGFTPYFHNVNHRGNFTEAINIFSNPLEKGLEAVWPDQRPRQRERFDDQVLRDGLIIRNNTQVRTLAFFPKELLRLPLHVESEAQHDAWRNNAREVRERLGELVVIGDLIQYVNRISLTANALGPVAPPPTIVGTTPSGLKQGGTGRITISGSNFQGAQLSIGGSSGIHIVRFDVDLTGHFITADLSVEPTVKPDTYRINVSTPSSLGTGTVDLIVERETIKADELIYDKKKAGTSVSIEVKGTYLHTATIRASIMPANSLTVANVKQSVDGKSLNATVVVPTGTAPMVYKLEVFDPKDETTVIKKDFEVLPP